MADIAFTCPECGHAYQFASHLAGKRGRCKTCQAVFRIPAPTTTAASTPPARREPAPAGTASRPGSVPPALPPAPVRPADGGKVVFNCPTCGHGYRLDAKLAGKQGRCTSCRGVFTIPARSGPSGAAASDPAPSSSTRGRGPELERPARVAVAGSAPSRAPSGPAAASRSSLASRRPTKPPAAAAGDSGWWELDSSESIPTTTAQAGAGRSRGSAAVATTIAAVPVAAGRAALARRDHVKEPIVTARPVRPLWVTYAAIAGGVLLGVIAITITFSLILSAPRSGSSSSADQPKDQPEPVTSSGSVADAAEPSADPVPQRSGAVAQHREAVDALIRAYNDIADGYARIRDADSIAEGKGLISRGVEHLKRAARRGRSLPTLAPPDREDVIRHSGPPLLQAVDRVLDELRRLKFDARPAFRLRPADRRLLPYPPGDPAGARAGLTRAPGRSSQPPRRARRAAGFQARIRCANVGISSSVPRRLGRSVTSRKPDVADRPVAAAEY